MAFAAPFTHCRLSKYMVGQWYTIGSLCSLYLHSWKGTAMYWGKYCCDVYRFTYAFSNMPISCLFLPTLASLSNITVFTTNYIENSPIDTLSSTLIGNQELSIMNLLSLTSWSQWPQRSLNLDNDYSFIVWILCFVKRPSLSNSVW